MAPAPVPLTAGGVRIRIGESAIIQIPPRTFRARLTGLFFELDRTFLLPGALPGMERLRAFFEEHPGMSTLVVGHADRAGQQAPNQALSVERAQVVAEFLRDDAGAWAARWSSSTPAARRWSTREDQLLLAALDDGATPFHQGTIDGIAGDATTGALRRFQEWSNASRGTSLAVDGDAGPDTRRALCAAYMERDGTPLPAGAAVEVHGCGENHPEVPTADGVTEERNRRVEVFLFEGPIAPPPAASCPAPGCAEYRSWQSSVVETINLRDEPGPAPGPVPVKLRLLRDGVALGSAPWRIRSGEADLAEGTTDGEGRLSATLPDGTTEAVLVISDLGLSYPLAIGALPPLDDPAGVIARLNNLGYDCEQADAESVRAAMVAFQSDKSLGVTGREDEATRAKLGELHGS